MWVSTIEREKAFVPGSHLNTDTNRAACTTHRPKNFLFEILPFAISNMLRSPDHKLK